MAITIAIILGLLFGSIPTAYLIVKKFNGTKITEEGSGNVGTMNAKRVSGSIWVAFFVLLIDVLKGLVPILIIREVFDHNFVVLMSCAISITAAHCYSPWLKFKGGKGLAAAFGATILFVPSVPAVWLVFWIISFIFKRIINFSNIVATILTGGLALINKDIMNSYSAIEADNSLTYGILVVLLMSIILSKHGKELKKFMNIE